VIELTALSGKTLWLNPHQIESMESTPDTTICLVFGKRIVVAESPSEVLARIVAYRRKIASFGESD
jgi:flagellar protein FlbD